MSVSDHDGTPLTDRPKVRSAEALVDMTLAEFRNWRRIFDMRVNEGCEVKASVRYAIDYVLALRKAEALCVYDDKGAHAPRKVENADTARCRAEAVEQMQRAYNEVLEAIKQHY